MQFLRSEHVQYDWNELGEGAFPRRTLLVEIAGSFGPTCSAFPRALVAQDGGEHPAAFGEHFRPLRPFPRFACLICNHPPERAGDQPANAQQGSLFV